MPQEAARGAICGRLGVALDEHHAGSRRRNQRITCLAEGSPDAGGGREGAIAGCLYIAFGEHCTGATGQDRNLTRWAEGVT